MLEERVLSLKYELEKEFNQKIEQIKEMIRQNEIDIRNEITLIKTNSQEAMNEIGQIRLRNTQIERN